MQFGARNSRVGLRMKAPEVSGIRVSGVVETDFLGNQSLGYATGQATENQYFTSPLLRIRHMYVKAETNVVDLLLGQTWDLFGWQSAYHPNTVEIQGVPGQIYSRTPQIRLSKTFKTEPVTMEIAAAAVRPPQRDSAWPEGQGGIRIAINGWTGVQTTGAAATSIQPMSIAFTGDVRHIDVPDLLAAPDERRRQDRHGRGHRRLLAGPSGLEGQDGQRPVAQRRVRVGLRHRRPLHGPHRRGHLPRAAQPGRGEPRPGVAAGHRQRDRDVHGGRAARTSSSGRATCSAPSTTCPV